MNPEEFLRRVEQSGLVNPALIAELKNRVSTSTRRLRSEMLAKLLVDRGELTPAQARNIISNMTTEDSAPTPPPLPGEPTPLHVSDEPSSSNDEYQLKTENDDLTLVTDDDDEPAPQLRVEDVLGTSTGGLDGDDILGSLGDDLWPEDGGPKRVDSDYDDDTSEFKLADEKPDTEDVPVAEVAEAILIDDDDDDVDRMMQNAPPGAEPPEDDTALGDLLADPVIQQSASPVVLRRKRSLGSLILDLFPSSRGPRKNRWDSPLILVGGGTLIVLFGLGFLFFTLFYSESADELFTTGQDAYESQSYGQAVQAFERFRGQFPTHEKASLAHVRIELSQLRQITDLSSPNWVKALQHAQVSLPTIKDEPAFSQARPELAKLLPDIAAGLVETAKRTSETSEKQRVIELSTNALEMVNNPEYLPTSIRQPQELRIDEIESDIQLVRRDIEQALALSSAVDKIKALTESGDIAAAYRERDELIDTYPIVATAAELLDVLQAVTAKEKTAVRFITVNDSPATEDHVSPIRVKVVLSDERGESLPSASSHSLAILARGSVYGIEAQTGKTLWRRYVGFDAAAFPQSVDDTTSSDFLIVDAAHQEVQRVDAETGSLVWRLSCPLPIHTPQVLGDNVYVCCGTGSDSQLRAINVATGQVERAVQFPVGCDSAPTVLTDRNEIVQLGRHSSAYVLEAQSLDCKSVFSTGHVAGSVAVSPTYVGNLLLITTNNGSDASELNTFAIGQNNEWAATSSNYILHGQVLTNPSVDGRRVLVATEFGELRALEAVPDGNELREIATIQGEGIQLGPGYVLLNGSDVWVANQTLVKYELQSTRGVMVPKWSRDRDDRFVHPIQRRGGYLFHVRRRVGMMGATIAATQVTAQGQPLWETDIAVPSQVLVGSGQKVYAVTMNGALFPIDQQAVNAGVTNAPSARIDPRLLPSAFQQQLELPDNKWVFATPPPTSHIFVADLATGQMRRVLLRIAPDVATAPLANIENTLLVAVEAGPVYMVDAVTGNQQSHPYMPRIEAGVQFDWLMPTGVVDSKQQFVAGESGGALHRVEFDGQRTFNPAQSRLPDAITGGLAAAGDIVYAVTQIGSQRYVAAIDVESLQVRKKWELRGGIAWGPQRIGDVVFAADAESLMAFDGHGSLMWRSDIVGPLAGAPVRWQDRYIVATTNGQVLQIDGRGQRVASQQLDEPLGSSPVNFRGKLLISGWDGTLYLIDPTQ